MKILIIGGKGTIGSKVSSYFSKNNEVVIAGRSGGDTQVDIADSESVAALFEHIGVLDAIICTAGEAKWAPFDQLSESDFYIGLKSKLMGQVNLVRYGSKVLGPGGSITLTTGILADDPVPMTSSAAMVNGAIHSFVKAVALELGNGIRVNAVSSGLVEDAVEKYKDYFPGHHPIPMDKMLRGYIRSVEGKGNGEIIRIYD
ncbi:short chain dehydrogenase [Muriicola sp. Z0-33]|uniref:short chain dehydrogenase n=1 Tax=Muriicola sp. Z0-33 TaxID=2816957 RepID=UPI002238C37C|nr:short chain dehydrogenase [Muriicola sp. Z0-33]MCW5517841.1 short chain dehydrogenase [Muriicola sp. Z0-33]